MTFPPLGAFLTRGVALLAWAIVLLSLGCAGAHSERRELGSPALKRVQNGMYAVIGEPVEAPRVRELPNQRQLRYDPRMADLESAEPVQFVTVETSGFVPLILSAAPEHTKQEDGRILIRVALSKPYVQTLADFTQAHLGRRVALVLDGEVMSTHKVRTVITGGLMQITRCDEHACERILSKFADSYDAAKTQ